MNQMKITLLIIYMFYSCIPYEVVRDADKFEKTESIYLKYNFTDSKNCGSIHFFPRIHKGKDGQDYFLEIKYYGKDLVFIEQDQSLTMEIDDKLFRFNGEANSKWKTVHGDGSVTEIAIYSVIHFEEKNLKVTKLKANVIRQEDIKLISFAKKIDAKLSTRKGNCLFSLNEENFENLQRFYNEEILGIPKK